MGTWGTGFFENDAASDWLEELIASDDISIIERCVHRINDLGTDYLDADLGAEGLVASSAIALLAGRGGGLEPKSLLEWSQSHSTAPAVELLASARAAVHRIAMTPSSELANQWSDSELAAQWRLAIDDLLVRLR
jgi:hypothetical protein